MTTTVEDIRELLKRIPKPRASDKGPRRSPLIKVIASSGGGETCLVEAELSTDLFGRTTLLLRADTTSEI